MTERFLGTVQELAKVDPTDLINWVGGIPFTDWPQQHKLADGKIRPAMACDPEWYGFRDKATPLVNQLIAYFPDCVVDTLMLSAVMSGHSIPPHVDLQSNLWRVRVHVPLVTNDQSRFIVGGVAHRMETGKAYLVNTLAEHLVTNDGDTARVHLMFDVRLK